MANTTTSGIERPYFNLSELGCRYSFVKNLGHGAYGAVVEAFDNVGGKNVAVKKVLRLHEPLHLIRTLREIRISSRLRHNGITIDCNTLNDWFCEKVDASIGTVVGPFTTYIILPIMPANLEQVIKHCFTKLTDSHKRSILYQVLRATKYIHSANVIHRDLKPSNILVDEKCKIQICDYNLARVRDLNENGLCKTGPFTQTVQTRYYRAPEALFMCNNYDTSLDVWSIGCILAELINGRLLFPGESDVDQLHVITDIVGPPTEQEVRYFQNMGARTEVFEIRTPNTVYVNPWPRRFPTASVCELSLLNGLLKFAPPKRLTLDQALEHCYVMSVREADKEPLCERPFAQELKIDGAKWTVTNLQKLLVQWDRKYHAPTRAENWDAVELDNAS